MIKLFYTTYNSVDLANHEIFGTKVVKGGIVIHVVWFVTVTSLLRHAVMMVI